MIRPANKRMTAALSASLVSLLQESPKSYEQLASATGLNKRSVARWISQMQGSRSVHIADYGPDINGRLFVPLWAWGNQPHARRPGQAKTNAERMREKRLAGKGVV